MNGIPSKYHITGTYKTNKISLPCLDDKIYIQSNGYKGLALAYCFNFQSNQDRFFCQSIKILSGY